MRHFLCVLALALLPWSAAGAENPDWAYPVGPGSRPARQYRVEADAGQHQALTGTDFGLHNPDPKARFQRREILSSRAKGFAWRTAFTNSKGRRF